MTIVEMLARNARMYPDEIALIELRPSKGMRKQVTWKEFDEAANRVANALIDRGVKKGDRVIHLMMNSINWLEAYFGILRTGAWAVPLNFRFTARDIKYCVDIAEARVMILGEEFTERVESIRSQLPTIQHYIFVGQNLPQGMESFEEVVKNAFSDALNVELRDSDEAALYFTSGTTGAPKPILHLHKNLENSAITENHHHFLKRTDNFILIPPLYHCGAKMHWFGNLIVGARATILTEFSPLNLFEAVQNEKGTVVWLLVPWVQDIIAVMERGQVLKEDYDLSSWRLMHMGAQPIPPSLVIRWKRHFPNMQYDTSYGLSEATGPGCVDLGIENEHKVGAIGRPGFNWETRVVDENGKDVPRGQIGELIVRGNAVMKCYYKNPEKTAEAIKEGWLYTGDMAKVDDEGFIFLVDRKKDLIIVGGENIFPVEVEDVIRTFPKVLDVGVIGMADERMGEVVAAVIDPKPGQTVTEAEVVAFCEQNLPRYKRPRYIIFDKVPRNPTGKIEKPKMREKYTGNKESFRVS